jgi:hypothetical protein
MEEHCVRIYLKLSQEHGRQEEMDSIHELSDVLEESIEKVGAGEFDGDEFGGGECTLYMYGPDADKLFEAIRKPLMSSPLAKGGYVLKRYGPPADGVKEVRIDL